MRGFVLFWRFFGYRIHIWRDNWLYITEYMYFVPTNDIVKVPFKNIDIWPIPGTIYAIYLHSRPYLGVYLLAHISVTLSPKSIFKYTKMIYSSSRFRCCQDLSSVTFLSKVAILCHFVPFCAIGATLGVRAQIWFQKLRLMYTFHLQPLSQLW